jgi:SNF2 family DNA or RNA helicase
MIYTTKPYEHQVEALTLAQKRNAFAYFLEQGTGKSKIIIDEIVNLIEEGKINCAVILAPNGVHINWRSELLKHGPPDYDKWAIQVWKSSQHLSKKEADTIDILRSGKCFIFIMNIESLSNANGVNYLRRVLLARRRVYMVIDESHKIKTYKAQRTKNAINLGKLAYIKRIATGTEAEEGLEGLYPQFKFLDENIIDIKTYTAFKSMYCITLGIEKGVQIVGYQNQEHLARKIRPFTYQKRKKDCLSLPDKVYVTHDIELTKEQERIYNKLQDELILELESGAIVDVTQAMTRMMRLQQVLCGHVGAKDEIERQNVIEEIPSNRANYVAELVEAASGKAIVFCRFVKDVELISTALVHNSIRAVAVSGLIEGSKRMLEIDRWRQEKDTKALVITISTGGTGLTLNEANTTIFYSNSWSSTDRIQAMDRNHRIGQDSKVTYHDLIVRKHIDHRLLNVLRQKQGRAMEFRSLVEIQKFLTEGIEDTVK